MSPRPTPWSTVTSDPVQVEYLSASASTAFGAGAFSIGDALGDTIDSSEDACQAGVYRGDEALPEFVKSLVCEIDSKGWEMVEWTGNNTLLHWAAKNNKPRLCKHLRSKGADPFLPDDRGNTPMDYAKQVD